MSLNLFVAFDPSVEGSDHKAFITNAESPEEAQAELEESGSEETVVDFISIDGDAADALHALAAVNIEHDGSIGKAIEELVLSAFNAGMSYENKTSHDFHPRF
jgi:hypothetical protein